MKKAKDCLYKFCKKNFDLCQVYFRFISIFALTVNRAKDTENYQMKKHACLSATLMPLKGFYIHACDKFPNTVGHTNRQRRNGAVCEIFEQCRDLPIITKFL